MLLASPYRHRQPSVTESAARSRLIRGVIMPSLQLKMAQDNPAYTISQLVELRRQMLRFARSLTRGSSERIERRQIAASLGGLYRNKRRLDVHIGEG